MHSNVPLIDRIRIILNDTLPIEQINEVVNQLREGHNFKTLLVINDGEPTYLLYEDILYIEKQNKDTYIHTMDFTYKYHDCKTDLVEVFESEKDFLYVDKRMIINVERIEKFSVKQKVVYFHKTASKSYPFAIVPGRTIDTLRKDLNFGKDYEVADEDYIYSPINMNKLAKN